MHGSEFDQVVMGTCDFLRGLWPNRLAKLCYTISEVPSLSGQDREVPRYRINQATQYITFYRVPLERLNRASGATERKMQLEHQVLHAVADLLELEPWQVLEGEKADEGD